MAKNIINKLKKIIKEGTKNVTKKTILESEKKALQEELNELMSGPAIVGEREADLHELLGMKRINPMEVLKHYFMAAFWTEEDELEGATTKDLSNKAKLSSLKDVEEFITKAGSFLSGMKAPQVGHDLWLTRNGHGTGFWDRGMGEIGDALSKIATDMGAKNLYRGDDGKIHVD